MNSDKIVYEYLLGCGFNPKLLGFKYLIDAINIYLESEYINSYEKDIYLTVANKYDKNPGAIKKAIKNAIDTAALNYNLDDESCVFNAVSNVKSGSIAAAEFIACSAQKIKYHT